MLVLLALFPAPLWPVDLAFLSLPLVPTLRPLLLFRLQLPLDLPSSLPDVFVSIPESASFSWSSVRRPRGSRPPYLASLSRPGLANIRQLAGLCFLDENTQTEL